MKKNIKIFILVAIVGIIGYLAYTITQKIQHKNTVAERLQHIPAFAFKTLSGNTFTQKDLNPLLNTVFVYFNSECEHCQYETESIGQSLDHFKNTQLVFVSYEALDTIKTFMKSYGLLDKPNVIILQDEHLVFANQFDAKGIPYVLIYNTQKELVKTYKGQVKPEAIVKHLSGNKQ